MKKIVPFCGSVGVIALGLAGGALLLSGCGKSEEAAPPPPVHATPSPTPDVLDVKDLDATKLRHKANQAAAAIGKYLENEDPKLKAKVQKFADKMQDKLGKDKDQWRQRLEEHRKELQPKIDELRQQLGQSGEKAKGQLSDQLAKLEGQDKDVGDRLARLQSIGADAWKKFRAQLKDEEAKQKEKATPGAGAAGGSGKAEATPGA